MTANQDHGFVFEDRVVKNITGFNKDDYAEQIQQAGIKSTYTAAWDIYNGIHADQDYSIKVTGGGSVGCGDILRFYDHTSCQQFTMIVGAWRQTSADIKTYDTIYEFCFTPSDHQLLFAELPRQDLADFVDYVKQIPAGKQAQLANQKLWKQKRKDLVIRYGSGLVKIDAKIDSNSQRRVQCSFKIPQLIAAGVKHVYYSASTNRSYRGIQLPYEQSSQRRVRNKKSN